MTRAILSNERIYFLNIPLGIKHIVRGISTLSYKYILGKEIFLKKHFSKLKRYKRYIYQFYYTLGKDWSKIGYFKKAKKYYWQAFLCCPLKIKCLFKILHLNIKSGHYGYCAFKRNSELKRIIKNQRVLIIGSGSSVNELEYIPGDVKILTCNIGPRILFDKKISEVIDLYYCVPGAVERGHKNENILGLLSNFKINLFIYPTKWIKNSLLLKNVCAQFTKDYTFNGYYLNKLIGPQKTQDIKSNFSSNNRTSSGIRLLQYALYAQAKEIFLIGIDMDEKGYFWGRNNIHDHLSIDKNFIEIVSKKYSNIYSASKNSPIVRYIKYRSLL